jgi:hypothetical protein
MLEVHVAPPALAELRDLPVQSVATRRFFGLDFGSKHDQTNRSTTQILASIQHVRKSELEAAITLGLAAEGMLPATEKEHLFPKVKDLGKTLEGRDIGAAGPNDVGIWLKHGTYQSKSCEAATISELEALAVC